MDKAFQGRETSTEDQAKRWSELLQYILIDANRHARWLNTLSLLEHIGSRKIIKALDSTTLDETLLRHIAEEARHAYFFKKLAGKIAPSVSQDFQDHNLFYGREAKTYFQALDHRVFEWVQTKVHESDCRSLTYLIVTTLIELRALQIYRIYQRLLEANGAPLSLKSVLTEEDKHLSDMKVAFEQHKFDWSAHESHLLQIENQLMDCWLAQLETAIGNESIRTQHSTSIAAASETPSASLVF